VKSFHEFLGRYSQSLTRWLLHARDRHDHQTKEPELHHPKGLTLTTRFLAFEVNAQPRAVTPARGAKLGVFQSRAR
jgi:hypothetical protein